MPPPPRAHLRTLRPAVHGGMEGAELEQLGIDASQLLDFSVNINPAETPGELKQLLLDLTLSRYPDSDCLELRRAAAKRFGVHPEQVLAANGSVELIRLLCLAYLDPGDVALVGEPTFGEYELAVELAGGQALCYPLFPDAPSGPALSRMITDSHPKLAFICNPNNPTGDFLPPRDIRELAVANPQTLVIADEAYLDFVPGGGTVVCPDMPANLLALRSMTKFAALAGLRLGLLFGLESTLEPIRRVQAPWNVNVMAQAAGSYVLSRPELGPDLDRIEAAKAYLMGALGELGLEPRPSRCNFFLVDVGALQVEAGEGEPQAAAVRRRLLKHGCLVRDCTSFGLPEYIRIAVRTMDDCQILIDAFRHMVAR